MLVEAESREEAALKAEELYNQDAVVINKHTAEYHDIDISVTYEVNKYKVKMTKTFTRYMDFDAFDDVDAVYRANQIVDKLEFSENTCEVKTNSEVV